MEHDDALPKAETVGFIKALIFICVAANSLWSLNRTHRLHQLHQWKLVSSHEFCDPGGG